jgi:hypothetical protein
MCEIVLNRRGDAPPEQMMMMNNEPECLTMAFAHHFKEFDLTAVSSNAADGYGQAAIRIGENVPGHQDQIIMTVTEAWKLAERLIAECEKVELDHRKAASLSPFAPAVFSVAKV